MSLFDYELAGCLTEDYYEASIPARCAFQVYRSHANSLMLCWGLVSAIESGERMDCTGCDMERRNSSRMNRTTTYFHGGRPGLKPGAFLLPPCVTNAPSLSDYGADEVHRKDRVYVTTNKTVALLFAAGVIGGVIYECDPVGDLEPDPDCSMPDISWQCDKAVVIRVIKPKAKDVEMVRAALFDV